MPNLDIQAIIKGIKYKHFLCKELPIWAFEDIESAFLSRKGAFLLKVNENNIIALSWWVSSKRTRSYPYARVYDTLSHSGRKITVIPIYKDEGKDGDRDFIQWDTISLMSLLDVYVIIAYYVDAEANPNYSNKITNQSFDVSYIESKINEILDYKSSALHWNISQAGKLYEIKDKAIESYKKISEKLNVEMHSFSGAGDRLSKLSEDIGKFMKLSRELAKEAQQREIITIQPSESLEGEKAKITIKNFLGGEYYFTVDEAEIKDNQLLLIEGKHTRSNKLPTWEDVKDGLIKMILYTNLEDIQIDGKSYVPKPILKLTSGEDFDINALSKVHKSRLSLLIKEAQENSFNILINDNLI